MIVGSESSAAASARLWARHSQAGVRLAPSPLQSGSIGGVGGPRSAWDTLLEGEMTSRIEYHIMKKVTCIDFLISCSLLLQPLCFKGWAR